MYIALTDLDFLLRSAQNCKKCTFLDKLQTITQEGNMETRQVIPFFSSTFSALTVCNTFLYLKIVKIHFHVVPPPFGPFWSVKYLNFGQKLPIRTSHHNFLESRHPEVTKNRNYVFSSEGNQKKVSARSWTNVTFIS